MRDILLLSIVCLLVVAGVGWLLFPGQTSQLFRSRIDVHAETPEEQAPSSPPAATAPPTHPQTRKVAVTMQSSPEPKQIASVALISDKMPAQIVPQQFQLHIPSPYEVLPGAEKSDLLDVYGAPALATSTQEAGHLFETYVYRSTREQAIVHLEDGRVSGVNLKDSTQIARP